MKEHVDLTSDRVGRIEQAGVEYLPEAARDSSPWNVAAVFLGSGFTWTAVIYGWLAIQLGLSFWQALPALLIGGLLGVLVVLPTALIGPRTGTNMTVASGAEFGIRGRFIGSGLALATAVVFGAITVWTSGDALVAAGARMFGTSEAGWVRGIAYGVIGAAMVAIALFGHATIVAAQKIIVPVVGVLMLAGVFAFAGRFDGGVGSGEYALGGFAQTWVLAVVISASGPISYATTIGDYTRRVSHRRYRDRHIAGALGLGLYFGGVIPASFGAFTASALSTDTGSYASDLVAAAPLWFTFGIVVISILGGLGQGVLCIYGSGLDLEGVFPRLLRVQTTMMTAALVIALLYVGVFVFDAVDSVSAVAVILNAVVTPWVVIMVIGALRRRVGGYDVLDLQTFAQGRTGGRYWYTGGWHLAAVVAWAAGAVVGVLAIHTTVYTGPIASIADGIDISMFGSGLVAAAVYLVAVRLWENSTVSLPPVVSELNEA
ncbi:purine/cytosine permease [Nocardia brasiliensis]|uniref:Purine/cytosine permease n=1 Tax=Nocardia brasiliensis TaxID=37326 RepID=A0A6G9XTD6_NOCBR|nr:cytosine permease [Nocardia brasiliensis]QIS04212.1 purine/cytosine permease [Nocardia brasiliensis]